MDGTLVICKYELIESMHFINLELSGWQLLHLILLGQVDLKIVLATLMLLLLPRSTLFKFVSTLVNFVY